MKERVDPDVILDIISAAHDAAACNYFLKQPPPFLSANWYDKMKAVPTLWETFAWRLLINDGTDTGEEQVITYTRMSDGLKKMLEDEINGRYKHRWYRVADVISSGDCDSHFAQEVIQYAIFGKIIFG